MIGKKLTVRNMTLESGATKIAVPITGKTSNEILTQVQKAAALSPDVIEWRIDYFDQMLNHSVYSALLSDIKALIGQTVLLTTFRTIHEGGQSPLSDNSYFSTYRWLIENNLTDLLDIEINRDKASVDFLIKLAHEHHVAVILSHHNFEETPLEDVLVDRLKQMQDRQADIGKIAVMPHTVNDVLTLLRATERANRQLNIPLITMSMGQLGKISRLSGSLFGSVMSFAAVDEASAPGQLSVSDLRKGLEILNP